MMKNELEKYNDQGYIILKNVFPQEFIRQTLSQVEELLDRAFIAKDVDPKQYASLDQKYYALKERFPKIKSHAYDLLKHLDSLWKLATYPQTVEFIRSIAQTPLLLDNVAIRMDDASNDWMSPMHQEGFGQISLDMVNLWAPLRTVNQETGTVSFIPESHKLGWVEHTFHEDFNNKHGVHKRYIDQSKIQFACMDPGDVLIFDSRLIHGSSPKKTKDVRWTFVARYNTCRDVPYLRHDDAPKHTAQVAG